MAHFTHINVSETYPRNPRDYTSKKWAFYPLQSYVNSSFAHVLLKRNFSNVRKCCKTCKYLQTY